MGKIPKPGGPLLYFRMEQGGLVEIGRDGLPLRLSGKDDPGLKVITDGTATPRRGYPPIFSDGGIPYFWDSEKQALAGLRLTFLGVSGGQIRSDPLIFQASGRRTLIAAFRRAFGWRDEVLDVPAVSGKGQAGEDCAAKNVGNTRKNESEDGIRSPPVIS